MDVIIETNSSGETLATYVLTFKGHYLQNGYSSSAVVIYVRQITENDCADFTRNLRHHLGSANRIRSTLILVYHCRVKVQKFPPLCCRIIRPSTSFSVVITTAAISRGPLPSKALENILQADKDSVVRYGNIDYVRDSCVLYRPFLVLLKKRAKYKKWNEKKQLL